MIKTQAEYANAIERLATDREVIEHEEAAYREQGLNDEQVERALEPHRSFHKQLQDEVEWYESVRRGEPYCLESLQDIGKMLVALRIGLGMTQRDFARAVGVDESQVSRDERNEYHGITVKRVEEILSKVGASIQVQMRPPSRVRPIQDVAGPTDAKRLAVVSAG